MTTIDLLRHGDAAPGLCLGRGYDAPLTPAGWSRMRAILEEAKPPWNGVATSPLVRCAAFAEVLAKRHGLPLKHDSRFCELGFGAWEGRSWSDLYAEEGELLLEFQRKPGFNPAPGGEHYPDFEARVAQGWADLLEKASGEHWLLVTHAGVLRAIFRLLLGFPAERLFSIHIPYAALARIEQEIGQPPRLVFHGGRL